MKKLNTFEDYIFNKIFESNGKETTIIISNRLKELLSNIEHPIAYELYEINDSYNNVKSDKATLIDLDDKEISNFTYTIPSKLIDYTEKELPNYKEYLNTSSNLKMFGLDKPEIWTKYRSSIKIGKLISKIYPNKYDASGKPGKDIESFTNLVKFEIKKKEDTFSRFKIVEGEDIKKYYNESSYSSNSSGSILGSSCMRYNKCHSYIDFYANNKGVKLVILMSENEEDKIIGRALLWDIVKIDGEEVDRKFMDRIYSIQNSDTLIFKEYAKRNNWLYKYEQNMYSDEEIVDSTTNERSRMSLETVDSFEKNRFYPYMDTMKYFYYEIGCLSNTVLDDDYYFLESTSGGYTSNGGDDDVDADYIYCELGNDSVPSDEAIWIEQYGEYATQNYVDNNMVYSDIEDSYIENDESTYSEYHGDYISTDNSIEVFNPGASNVDDINKINFDNLDYIDSNYTNYFIRYMDKNGYYYYFSKEDDDNFENVFSLKLNKNIYVHKIWDKDKIFIYKGKKYLNDNPEKKDKLIGQKRIDF